MKLNLDDMSLPVQVAGVTFRNPFYVSSGPTSKSIEHLLKAAECGWAGASIKLTFDPAPYVSIEPRYGWFADEGFLAFSAESRLNVDEGLRLIEDGRRQTRDFTFVEDTSWGICAAATYGKNVLNDTYNITRGEARSLWELVEIVKGHFPDLRVRESEDLNTFRQKRGALDISKAKLMLKYEPAYSLEDGVAAYIAYMRKHNPSLGG